MFIQSQSHVMGLSMKDIKYIVNMNNYSVEAYNITEDPLRLRYLS
jgi:hypothetical protein